MAKDAMPYHHSLIEYSVLYPHEIPLVLPKSHITRQKECKKLVEED
jgi:hypothetical protein